MRSPATATAWAIEDRASMVMTLAFFRIRLADGVAAAAGSVAGACAGLAAAIDAATPAPALIRKSRRGIDPVPMAASSEPRILNARSRPGQHSGQPFALP